MKYRRCSFWSALRDEPWAFGSLLFDELLETPVSWIVWLFLNLMLLGGLIVAFVVFVAPVMIIK
jgi:hypothetical protein